MACDPLIVDFGTGDGQQGCPFSYKKATVSYSQCGFADPDDDSGQLYLTRTLDDTCSANTSGASGCCCETTSFTNSSGTIHDEQTLSGDCSCDTTYDCSGSSFTSGILSNHSGCNVCCVCHPDDTTHQNSCGGFGDSCFEQLSGNTTYSNTSPDEPCTWSGTLDHIVTGGCQCCGENSSGEANNAFCGFTGKYVYSNPVNLDTGTADGMLNTCLGSLDFCEEGNTYQDPDNDCNPICDVSEVEPCGCQVQEAQVTVENYTDNKSYVTKSIAVVNTQARNYCKEVVVMDEDGNTVSDTFEWYTTCGGELTLVCDHIGYDVYTFCLDSPCG